MSTMRGIVPSLGAGGSLIAASLCAFVVLSAMFAFRDEGGGTAEARSGQGTMPRQRRCPRPRSQLDRLPDPSARPQGNRRRRPGARCAGAARVSRVRRRRLRRHG